MSTARPLLHPIAANRLSDLQSRPPHALLLAGPAGIGKTTIARWLAASLLEIPNEKLDSHPHFIEIAPQDGKAIGIEGIRQLEHVISLKVPSKQQVSRLVLISDAHLLTTEAQNSLLKTLEEPPAGTVLLLTSSQQEGLLPTIQSRLQTIEITPPAPNELEQALTDVGVKSAELPQLMALSGGLPGLAFALARHDEEHPLVAAAQIARQLLQQSTFEKLCQVDGLAKNREAGRNVIHLLMQMAHAALLTGRSSDRWKKVLQAAYQADRALTKGTQPKLALTNLMLNL